MFKSFPALAVEVVEFIASYLGGADIRSLRLVSRELNEMTLSSFGRTSFATIQTDLSRNSLERIQSISKFQYLAVHVQCLKIKELSSDAIGQGFAWPRSFSGFLAENLTGTALLQDLLSQRLRNCRSFLICSHDEYKTPFDADRLVPSDVVGIIMSIAAEADILIRSFSIQSDQHGNGRLDTLRLRVPLSQTPKFVKAWSGLEELILDYAITPDQWEWALHLISSASRLRKLSLGFYEKNKSFLQQLSSVDKLNRLEELGIGSASLTIDAITSLILTNRKTLRSLSLRYTNLEDEGKWSTLFEDMTNQLPQLQNLELFWLKQGTTRNNRVRFPKLSQRLLVPGSEVRVPHRLKHDSRRIESVKNPIRLRYWGSQEFVVGVTYYGKEIDYVLGALADTVENF